MKSITIKLFYFIFPLTICCVAVPAWASVVKLKLSGPATAPVGEIIQLSIQAQNDLSKEEEATETIYFTPKSSPSAGEFSPRSTWEGGSFYIRKGSANKTFYYRNSSAGKQTITVENEKGLAVDSITIDIGGQSTGGDATSTDDDSSDYSSDSGSSSSGGSTLSSHSSQADLSDYKEDEIKIGAGRPRLVSAKTPLEFKVENAGNLAGLFTWSFGDGTSAIGRNVEHQYQFPGKYNVVLNFLGDSEAVSRTAVTVTEARFNLAVFPSKGYLEIENLGSQEENINSWTIKNGTTAVFTFARDTIIDGHSQLKISLPTNVLVSSLSLNYPDGTAQALVGRQANVSKVIELEAELAKAKEMLAVIKQGQWSESSSLSTALPTTKEEAGENNSSLASVGQSVSGSSSDIIIIEKKEGIISRFLKTFKFF